MTTQRQLREQNAKFRVVVVNEGGYLVYDEVYVNKGGLTSMLKRAQFWEDIFGWNYTVYDRQPDGKWVAR